MLVKQGNVWTVMGAKLLIIREENYKCRKNPIWFELELAVLI